MRSAMKIKSKIQKAFEGRWVLFNDSDTNCFRLFNSSGDGIKDLTVDLYGEYLLVQFFNSELYGEEEFILKIISDAIVQLPVDIRGILLKNRVRGRENGNDTAIRRSRLVEGEPPPENYYVRQNGINALVDLVEGQNTGIFLDMRQVREKLVSFYKEFENMLNLFSYTSLFSVHAVKNGVKYSSNVDLSKSNLRRAMMNYEINGLVCDERDFIYGDALHWIKRFRRIGQSFSFIVFDPPTFSRNKRRSFSIARDFKKWLNLLPNISAEGFILTSVNMRGVSESEYLSYHPTSWKIVFLQNESDDFRYDDGPYLKVGLWMVA
jgi:23S rRNA (cytosine1962-C5)-methyltransferase